MSYSVKGKIVSVSQPVTGVGQRGPWGRCTAVIEVADGNYKKNIALENTNKYEDFAKLQIGQEIEVKFDVSSREYQGKWYTTANCFAWTIIGAQQEDTNDEAF